MLDTMRKYVEAGMSAISTKRAEELARGLVNQGQAGKDQVSKVSREILEWSKKNGERLVSTVRREVKKQILSMGVATKSEVDALRKRVSALEGKSKPAGKSTGAKSPARKSTAKKSTGAKSSST